MAVTGLFHIQFSGTNGKFTRALHGETWGLKIAIVSFLRKKNDKRKYPPAQCALNGHATIATVAAPS